MKTGLSLAGAIAIAALVFASTAADARAERRGIFGRSGRTPNSTCATANCHGAGSGGSAASFTMTPVNPDLPPFSLGYVPGALYTVTVTVTGGPALRFGYNWDSDAGRTAVLDANSRKNTALQRPAEMAHTTTGSAFSTWSFRWTAPTDQRTVSFWLMGNSANNNNARTGDAPTPPVTAQATAVPAEILARIGNVNDAVGDPVPVLLVNGSRGDDERVVNVQTGTEAMAISLASYPGAPSAIPYVIYASRRANRAGDETTIPGVGLSAFSFPVTGSTPVVVMNTLAHEPQLGTPRVPSTPLGPGDLLTLPRIPSQVAGASITLQGLVPDATATAGGSVTNAVVVTFL